MTSLIRLKMRKKRVSNKILKMRCIPFLATFIGYSFFCLYFFGQNYRVLEDYKRRELMDHFSQE